MKRKNFPKRKEQKRQEAMIRNQKYSELPIEEKQKINPKKFPIEV